MPEERSLLELAQGLFAARQAEGEAKAKRIECEEAIAVLVPIEGVSGAKTVDAGAGIKIVVERGVTYTADVDAIRELSVDVDLLPINLVPAVPPGWAFDMKAYKKMEEKYPEAFAQVSKCITMKPKKTTVTLKLA